MASGVVGSSELLSHNLHLLEEPVPIFANLLVLRGRAAVADAVLQSSLLVLCLPQRTLCQRPPGALVIEFSLESQAPVVGFRGKSLSVSCHALGPLDAASGICRIFPGLALRLLRALGTATHVCKLREDMDKFTTACTKKFGKLSLVSCLYFNVHFTSKIQ